MKPKVYRDPHRAKILWGGIILAVVVLGFFVWATLYLDSSNKSSGAFTGKIVAMEFTPQPAQEITVGSGGLQSTRIEGEYLLKVQTPDGSRVFNVWVDKSAYDAVKVGDDYFVVPTP
ncbi:MAG: hypothetical protein FGM15_02970 [Chthoniobacterales bacterium]|nr:hypothetical protein [Chthoniobacterales bacterium]